MNYFDLTSSLPMTNCSREDVYNLLRTMQPSTNVVDDATIEVLAGILYAKLNVPRWKKVGDAVEHTDLQAAAESNDIALLTLPANAIVHAVKIKHSTAFAGAGFTEYRLSVGVSGNLTKYAAPFDVMQAVGDTIFALNKEVGGETHNATGTSLRLAATCKGANLSASTAGVVDVWVLYSATL